MMKQAPVRAMLASSGLCALLKLPNLLQPIGPDQGIMTVIGQGILRGEMPYRDLWEMATPAIFLTYAGILSVFGPRMVSVQLADLLTTTVTCALLVWIAAKASPRRPNAAGWVAGLAFALFSSGGAFGMNSAGDLTAGTHWYLSQRETYINVLAAGAFAIALLHRGVEMAGRPARRLAAAAGPAIGILAGCGVAYKFPAAALFVPAAVLLVLTARNPSGSWSIPRAAGRAIGMAAGAALVPGALLGWIVTRGAYDAMIEACLGYVNEIYGHAEYGLISTMKNGLLHSVVIVRENFLLWALAFAATAAASLGVLSAKAGGRALAGGSARSSAASNTPGTSTPALEPRDDGNARVLLLSGWWIAALVYVVSHREFFGYHYLVLLPPLAALSGCAFGFPALAVPARSGRLPLGSARIFLTGALVANLAVFAALNYRHFTRPVRVITGQRDMDWYYSHFTAWPRHEYSFPADRAVALYLRETTQPGDTVFVLGGIEPVIHFLSDRRCPSRFIYSWFLTDTTRADVPLAVQFREELAETLVSDPPDALVTIGPLGRFAKYPVLHDALVPLYELDRAFGDDRHVYRRRGLPAGSPPGEAPRSVPAEADGEETG